MLINPSLQPHPLKPELSTAAPLRMGCVGHKVLSSQARQPAVQMFEAESSSVCVLCVGHSLLTWETSGEGETLWVGSCVTAYRRRMLE